MAHTVRDKKKLLNRVRRLRGQVDAIEKALEQEKECSTVLHTVAACRGSFNSLMAEILESHIRFHIVNPDVDPKSEKSREAQELIDALRTYLR
jgi:FrmR/RcnR family transcriptional regulator, repressor of frmRAB operon